MPPLDLPPILDHLFSLLPVLPEQLHHPSVARAPCAVLCYRLLEEALDTVFGPLKKGAGWVAGRRGKVQADLDWLLGNPAALNDDLCLSCEHCCTALGIDFDYWRQGIRKAWAAQQTVPVARPLGRQAA